MGRKSDPELVESWRKVVARFQRSGVSQRQFCEDEGLSTSTLAYWLRKFEAGPQSSPSEGGAQFIRLFESSPSGTEPLNLVVELPGGVVLRFSGLAR